MTSPTAQVFISSTWQDLQPEREALEAVAQRIREVKFVGMEYFGSRDETTRRASLDEIDRSHVYVCLIGGRYGSGITEDEYRRARELHLPCFIYFKQEATIPPELREQDAAKIPRLGALKAELRNQHTVTEFSNHEELAAKVTADLHRWLSDNYLPTRPTFNAFHQLPSPPRDFTGRKDELNELMRALEHSGVTISGLQGLGGVGKTTLALKLAQQLTPRYPDAQFYLDLKGTSKTPLSAADAMAYVIRAYHPTARLPEGQAELSGLYRSVLHNQRAIEISEKALTISRELGDRYSESNALNTLGTAYNELGEMLQAIKFYEQALTIDREIGDHRSEGQVLCNLGNAYYDLNNMRRATEFYEQGLSVQREIGDQWGEGETLWNMSLVLDQLGELNEAIAHAEAALEILEQIEYPGTAEMRGQLAEWRGQENDIGIDE